MSILQYHYMFVYNLRLNIIAKGCYVGLTNCQLHYKK